MTTKTNYISCTTWIFGFEKPLSVDLEKRGSSYRIIMNIEHSKVELAIERDEMKALVDKINNALLDD